jgi:TetR/AcrR family transcriptional repressor of nem operon
MKVSKEENARNRQALVETAARLFREQGFEGTGVADVSRQAGLTHGAMYAHFNSKAALTVEANRHAQAKSVAHLNSLKGKTADDFKALVDFYLSPENLGDGCPMPAYVSEVGRQSDELRLGFLSGFEDTVSVIQTALPHELLPAEARRRAVSIVSALIGAVSMARATQNSNPALCAEILQAAHEQAMRAARCPM